jgi:diaminopropionate ammonia-lyase
MPEMPSSAPAELLVNPHLDRARAYGPGEREILSLAAADRACAVITQWPGYRPTPRRRLDRLARELGLAEILYKDEGERFVLKSFKALGGAYAVEALARERGAGNLVVACATDGNHGRAVAWGAQRAGCRAVIYIHQGVSEGRAEAIRGFGAEVRRAGRHYDDSVRIVAEDAAREGWQIVSDTSWPGYMEIPRMVMQGYALLAMEAWEAGARPTHVFVQGGVGGIAAGVLSWFWERMGPDRPILVVVEPDRAACVLASARAGALAPATGDLDTIMAGLACGEASPLAWAILDSGADAFMAIPDDAAADTMRELAGDGVVGGESGVAGRAGRRLAAADPPKRAALKLGADSRVLLFGTEGDTDPQVYRDIVGRSGNEVRSGAAP